MFYNKNNVSIKILSSFNIYLMFKTTCLFNETNILVVN
jgi:hypothetical protein